MCVAWVLALASRRSRLANHALRVASRSCTLYGGSSRFTSSHSRSAASSAVAVSRRFDRERLRQHFHRAFARAGRRGEVTRDALSDAGCLADVENVAVRSEKAVDARPSRQISSNRRIHRERRLLRARDAGCGEIADPFPRRNSSFREGEGCASPDVDRSCHVVAGSTDERSRVSEKSRERADVLLSAAAPGRAFARAHGGTARRMETASLPANRARLRWRKATSNLAKWITVGTPPFAVRGSDATSARSTDHASLGASAPSANRSAYPVSSRTTRLTRVPEESVAASGSGASIGPPGRAIAQPISRSLTGARRSPRRLRIEHEHRQRRERRSRRVDAS